ncbi:M1 family peptidase [Pseudonocardiaceae bacterium YIM PH 21723]|nr:M1 family peptidase [Pseudonocardiaceae bacterium YIM PH 21723]
MFLTPTYRELNGGSGVLRNGKLLLSVATVCAVTLLAGPAFAAAPTPGATTIGDPYYPTTGNGGYDAINYDVRLQYEPKTDNLRGTTTVLAKATQDLSEFSFDFLLKTSSVRVSGIPAAFTLKDGKLTVKPVKPLANGQQFSVIVQYEDVPSAVKVNGYSGWKKTDDGALAVQEPDVAPWWFPGNNHPRDKATFDISVEVPDGKSALSNGALLGKSSRLGKTRWNWRSTKPAAPYLISLEIGDFDVVQGTGYKNQPLLNAYSRSLGDSLPSAQASIERTPEVLEHFSGIYGEYPFEAQGGVVSPGLSFALENQTRPVYSKKFFDKGLNQYVVAHELGHQWWGDSVSVDTWRNIWLNEGFASYTEWLWSEHVGEGTAAELAKWYYDSYKADNPLWQEVIGDPGAGNEFGAVYTRGPLAVAALRQEIGDDNFFVLLKEWQRQHRYATGTIEQFQKLAEALSGKDLKSFFDTWLFTKGKPAYEFKSGQPGVRSIAPAAKPKSVDLIQHTHDLLLEGESH